MKLGEKIERIFPWSFGGFLLGIVAVLLALIIYYWQKEEERIDLRVQINSVDNLVELKEQIDDLAIIYKGRDITNAEDEIKIINFTLYNQGDSILQNYYDKNDMFGIKFYDSEIISFKLIETNSDYIQENIKPKIKNLSEDAEGHICILELSKVIIEKDDRVTFKVYLLQKREVIKPKLEVIGKIAGIKSIPIVYSFEREEASTKFGGRTPSGYSLIAFLLSILTLVVGMLTLLVTTQVVKIGSLKKNQKAQNDMLTQYFVESARSRIMFGNEGDVIVGADILSQKGEAADKHLLQEALRREGLSEEAKETLERAITDLENKSKR